MTSVFQTINPSNQQIIQEYEYDSTHEIESTLNFGSIGFSEWSRISVLDRVKHLKEFQFKLKENVELLAQQASLEMGKPILEAKAEVKKCVSMMDYYFENADEFLKPQRIQVQTQFKNAQIHYCPQGIILGIMPWNFPYWQVLRFAIPTLLAGNTVLIKHAPNVQGCQNKLQQIFSDSMNIAGIFQTLVAKNDDVERIIADDRIRGVSFTGSERVGRLIGSLAGKYLKKVVLELGGSDAYLVNEDADLNLAADQCVKARFLNAGQSCVSAKRWIVHKNVMKDFSALALEKIQNLSVGDPFLDQTNIGPLARLDLKQNLVALVRESIAQGANLLWGDWEQTQDESCFFHPLLLSDVRPSQLAFHEELFGPVACLISADNLEEMIKIANLSRYGLGGAIFMQDEAKAREIASQYLDTGGVFINQMLQSSPAIPFGGVKASGIGRELSHLSLYEFLNIKSVVN